MRSETGFDHALYDRFPTEKRPDHEIEELGAIWKAPKGWARLTAVNNNYVGFWYVVTAFGFFLADPGWDPPSSTAVSAAWWAAFLLTSRVASMATSKGVE